MSIGKIITDLRKKKGWSQDQLADKLGMNRANISNYERGVITNIPSDVLIRLSDVFNVSVDYLLGKTKDSDPVIPESEFISKLELPIEDLMERFTLTYKGRKLTEEEMTMAIAFLRTALQVKK